METYIFSFEGQGRLVAEALVRAARRGITVRVLVDGVGTGPLPAKWGARLTQAGVQLGIYAPLGQLGLLIPSRWRRLHRKLCVIDARLAFCGGINILDDHFDPHHGPLRQPRLDFAVRVQGPLVLRMHTTMQQTWWRHQVVRSVIRPLPQVLHALREARQTWPRPFSAPWLRDNGPARAGLLLRDNWRHRSDIERAYRLALARARSDILIANAYFLPGRKLRRALIVAAQRGVKVQLLLQGRYEYFMQYHAALPVYHALLAAGVEIYEYRASFLHAKVAVVDAGSSRAWATVGSSNLDPLSLLLAREANVMVLGKAFATQLHTQLQQAIAQGSRPVQIHNYLDRPWRQRVLDHVAYGLMRLALWLTGSRY